MVQLLNFGHSSGKKPILQHLCDMTKVAVSRKANRIAVATFFFIAGISFASWASRIPDIKEHLHLGDAGLGSAV